jgi:hypothetical protein
VNVLFLCYRPPWPPTCGPDNRVWQHLGWLAEKHAVTLVTFAPERGAAIHRRLAEACADVHYVSLERWPARVRAARALAGSIPLQVAYYDAPDVHRLVQGLLGRASWDLMYLNSVRMAPIGLASRTVPRLFDYTDAHSLQLRRRADEAVGWRRWLLTLESRRLTTYERRLARVFEQTIITSPLDAAAIGTDSPPQVVPVAAGAPVDVDGNAEGDHPQGDHNVGFIGDMRTSYSEMAILSFLETIWPRVKQSFPNAVFWIVGRDPSRRVRALARSDVRVTGTVPSLRPFYQGVQVVVAPLRFGSGVKTKVLEAMAAAVPVVGTRFANEGADAAPGVEMIVADEPAAFAEGIVTLLGDDELRKRLGAAGRAFAARRFGVEAVRGRFERAVEDAIARHHTTPSKARVL